MKYTFEYTLKNRLQTLNIKNTDVYLYLSYRYRQFLFRAFTVVQKKAIVVNRCSIVKNVFN